jgi:hypothetical protein
MEGGEMKYEGKLYGKVGNHYFPLLLTSNDVDSMEMELNELRKKQEIIAEPQQQSLSTQHQPVTDSNVMTAEEWLEKFNECDILVSDLMRDYATYVAEIKAKDVACKFIDDISEEWHRDADGWKNIMNAKVPESLRITAEQLYERWKEAQK